MLACLYLFAGGYKVAAPPEALAGPIDLPVPFLRFIGACEVLGALGLILPGLLRFSPGLTPLAAAGLAVIMCGATVVTALGSGMASALFPFAVGLLDGLVAWGRWRLLTAAARGVATPADARPGSGA